MKIIYSLKEFRERVTQISGKDENLVHVRAEIGLYGNREFSCYVDGLGAYYSGKTMEESLDKLQNAVNPPKPADIDVEIEMGDEKLEEPAIVEENKVSESDDLPF